VGGKTEGVYKTIVFLHQNTGSAKTGPRGEGLEGGGAGLKKTGVNLNNLKVLEKAPYTAKGQIVKNGGRKGKQALLVASYIKRGGVYPGKWSTRTGDFSKEDDETRRCKRYLGWGQIRKNHT